MNVGSLDPEGLPFFKSLGPSLGYSGFKAYFGTCMVGAYLIRIRPWGTCAIVVLGIRTGPLSILQMLFDDLPTVSFAILMIV